MSWMIREDQLDPDQKDFIDNKYKGAGNIWIKGFAGSGKSVLLVHSLLDVLRKNPRAKVVFVVFTHALIDMFRNGLKELEDSNGNLKGTIVKSANIPIKTYYDFVDHDMSSYDYIFCDEVQDLPQKVLEEMRSRGSKIIVAGDSNQSIYVNDPKWRQAVIEPQTIGEIINARAFQLSLIHRLTKSIIDVVQKLNPLMDIWGSKRNLTKIDVNVRLCTAKSPEKEVNYVFHEAKKGANVNETSAILLPKHIYIESFFQELLKSENKNPWKFKPNKYDIGKPRDEQHPDYNDLNNHLKNEGLNIQYIGNQQGSFGVAAKNKDVIVMTYHSSKGLDFDNVFLPFLNFDLNIARSNQDALFMVAVTRSKKNLYLTHSYDLHPYVKKIEKLCTPIDISNLNTPKQKKGGGGFDF